MLTFASPLSIQTTQRADLISSAFVSRSSQRFRGKWITPRRSSADFSRTAIRASVTAPSFDTLSASTISTVKSTVPALQQNAIEIGLKFYETLFERYPAFKKQFNIDRQAGGVTKDGRAPAQVTALTNSIIAFAKNIDNLPKIMPSMERIFNKHVSRGVTSEQYAAIGECFLFATKSVLGDAASQEVISAWAEAYGALAELYVSEEAVLQKALEEKAGYSGLVDMTVVDIEDGEKGRQISLAPKEVNIPRHTAGQYVSLLIDQAGTEPTMTSMKIADSEKDKLWIRVPESQERASRYLLDDVQLGSVLHVSVPCGGK